MGRGARGSRGFSIYPICGVLINVFIEFEVSLKMKTDTHFMNMCDLFVNFL